MAGERPELEFPQPIRFDEPTAAWIVTEPEQILEVLGDPRRFSNELWLRPRFARQVLRILASERPIPSSIGSTDPPKHTHHRKLLNVALTPSRIERLEPAIEAIVDALIDDFHARGAVDLAAAFCNQLPARVFGLLTSLSVGEVDQLMEWRRAWIKLAWSPADLETEKHHARQIVAMQRFFWELVEARRREPCDDVLSAMVTACLDGMRPLPEDQLVAEIMGLLEAGQETVSALVANSVLHLVRTPAHWRALAEDPALVDAAVDETLRLRSGIRAVFREATQDLELGGASIAKGDKLCVMLAAVGRDPRRFADPERYDVRRGHCPHMAFGKGTHFCIGAPLARSEGRLALRGLSRRLPDLQLAPGYVYETFGNLAFQIPRTLDVVWSPQRSPGASSAHG